MGSQAPPPEAWPPLWSPRQPGSCHRPISKVAPGTICDNFDQLLDALKNENYGSIDAVNFLKDKCTTNKMLASDKVIDYILLHKEVEDI